MRSNFSPILILCTIAAQTSVSLAAPYDAQARAPIRTHPSHLSPAMKIPITNGATPDPSWDQRRAIYHSRRDLHNYDYSASPASPPSPPVSSDSPSDSTEDTPRETSDARRQVADDTALETASERRDTVPAPDTSSRTSAFVGSKSLDLVTRQRASYMPRMPLSVERDDPPTGWYLQSAVPAVASPTAPHASSQLSKLHKRDKVPPFDAQLSSFCSELSRKRQLSLLASPLSAKPFQSTPPAAEAPNVDYTQRVSGSDQRVSSKFDKQGFNAQSTPSKPNSDASAPETLLHRNDDSSPFNLDAALDCNASYDPDDSA